MTNEEIWSKIDKLIRRAMTDTWLMGEEDG